MAAACGDESDESGGAAMIVLDWVQVVLLIAVQISMCVMCYFDGKLAGVRECKQIVDDFFASLEKKEDGED